MYHTIWLLVVYCNARRTNRAFRMRVSFKQDPDQLCGIYDDVRKELLAYLARYQEASEQESIVIHHISSRIDSSGISQVFPGIVAGPHECRMAWRALCEDPQYTGPVFHNTYEVKELGL